MKRTFISVLAIVFILSINSFAQMKFTFDAGLQLPSGNLKSTLNSGYGANVTLDYSLPLLPVALTFTAGYNRWDYKDGLFIGNYNFYTIPLMAGGRFYTGGTYIGADVGYSISNATVPGANSSSDFTFSPIIGYRFSLTPVGLVALDLNVRYWNISTGGSTSNWIGFNAGLAIGL